MTRLTEIANKHNTDKGTIAYEAHGYTEEYSKYIPEVGKFTLLEIGYWHGDSARTWKEYNKDLNLAFIDIDKNALNYNKENSNLYIGSATNPDIIDKVYLDFGDLDFIIDDGSHRYDDILNTFELLYPKLKSGGYYFIEDLHASYADREKVIKKIEGNLVCNNKLLIIQKP